MAIGIVVFTALTVALTWSLTPAATISAPAALFLTP